MLASSFCRREVRYILYFMAVCSVFAVFHVTLIKFERQVTADDDDSAIFGSSEALKTSPTGKKNKKGLTGKRKECMNVTVTSGEHFTKDTVVNITWTEEESEAQRKVLLEREELLHKACSKMDIEGALAPPLETVHQCSLWLKDYDLVYCPMNKVGSTTWISSLLKMAEKPKSHGRGVVRKIYSAPLGFRNRKAFMKKAMRMIIVRNPLDRLLSAYRDKMLHVFCKQNNFRAIQTSISSTYGDPDAIPDPAGRPSFKQFLLYIKEEMQKFWETNGEHEVNNHWKPFWWYCAPCHFEYNVIAHMETLDRDQEYILRESNLGEKINNTRSHSSKNDNFTSTREATKFYFGQVPRSLLEEIIRLYQPDFDLFGYTPDYHLSLTKK